MRGKELIHGVKEYLHQVFHRAPVDMGSNKITSLATPTADTDAATKKYVDDSIFVPATGRMYKNSNQSISATTWTQVTWNLTDINDPSSIVNMSNNRFVVPYDGVYEVHFGLGVLSAGEIQVAVYVNNTAPTSHIYAFKQDLAASREATGTYKVNCSASDTVEIYIYSSVANTVRGTPAAVRSWVDIARVS